MRIKAKVKVRVKVKVKNEQKRLDAVVEVVAEAVENNAIVPSRLVPLNFSTHSACTCSYD